VWCHQVAVVAFNQDLSPSGWPARHYIMVKTSHSLGCACVLTRNLLCTAGAGEELKLGDFGLTMSMKQELAISPVGTVEYMAPEVRFDVAYFGGKI